MKIYSILDKEFIPKARGILFEVYLDVKTDCGIYGFDCIYFPSIGLVLNGLEQYKENSQGFFETIVIHEDMTESIESQLTELLSIETCKK